jgi:hypothetical protein
LTISAKISFHVADSSPYAASLRWKTWREEHSLKVFENRVKVKFTLEQAMKAQRGSRGIALLFL